MSEKQQGVGAEHDSAAAASERYYDEAYGYFSQSARMDLDDYHNNFYAGIHAANMAGTWQAIVNGFAGLRCFDGKLSFRPYLPKDWEGYTFRLRFQDCVLRIEIHPETAKFTLTEGREIHFAVYEKEMVLTECGKSCEVRI